MPWVSEESKNSTGAYSPPQLKPITQMPLSMPMPVAPQMPFFNTNLKEDSNDVVCAFGNKTFHYLNPFQPLQEEQRWTGTCDELLSTEADSFFEDFDFPDHIGAEIEDDAIFSNMLEQMIA
jgi:hypothetical protein